MHLIRSRSTDLGLRSSSPTVNSILILLISIYNNIYVNMHILPGTSSHGSCSCRNKLSGQSSPLFPLVHESTASIKDTSRESVKECQVNILNGWIKMALGIRCMYACSFRFVSYRFVSCLFCLSCLFCRQCYCQEAI